MIRVKSVMVSTPVLTGAQVVYGIFRHIGTDTGAGLYTALETFVDNEIAQLTVPDFPMQVNWKGCTGSNPFFYMTPSSDPAASDQFVTVMCLEVIE